MSKGIINDIQIMFRWMYSTYASHCLILMILSVNDATVSGNNCVDENDCNDIDMNNDNTFSSRRVSEITNDKSQFNSSELSPSRNKNQLLVFRTATIKLSNHFIRDLMSQSNHYHWLSFAIKRLTSITMSPLCHSNWPLWISSLKYIFRKIFVMSKSKRG